MNRTLAAASASTLGLLLSGCAATFGCSTQCGEKVAETEIFSPRYVVAEINSLVARAQQAGMHREVIRQGNTGQIRTNYNEAAFVSFLQERLVTGIGPQANQCIRKHVVQNITWSVGHTMSGEGKDFSLLHNTWYNARDCGGSAESRQAEMQVQWNASAQTLLNLQFGPN